MFFCKLFVCVFISLYFIPEYLVLSKLPKTRITIYCLNKNNINYIYKHFHQIITPPLLKKKTVVYHSTVMVSDQRATPCCHVYHGTEWLLHSCPLYLSSTPISWCMAVPFYLFISSCKVRLTFAIYQSMRWFDSIVVNVTMEGYFLSQQLQVSFH